MDIEKKLSFLKERLTYICDIFAGNHQEHIRILEHKVEEFSQRRESLDLQERIEAITAIEELFDFTERRLEEDLSSMDKVRIVRHPQRICLRDILENVYDNYTEIGGQKNKSIDPSMLIARAYVTRRHRGKTHHQSVMVIGQEKGHGEDFRNGGSVKPWGNARALQYMKVAETENIPIHTYIFTPGAYPVEDYPGAAQQIARNLYEMAALKVPVIAVFSEGGSGGAEAIGLADRRLMLSHGYYSVISPEGAAAIEGRLRRGERATPELIARCAEQLKITAQDNLRLGYIDKIVEEPPLGARPYHYEFFRNLRREVIRATDDVVLSTRAFAPLRARAARPDKSGEYDAEKFVVRWEVNGGAAEKLLLLRHEKFNKYSRGKCIDPRSVFKRMRQGVSGVVTDAYNTVKHDILGKPKKRIVSAVEEVEAETRVLFDGITGPFRKALCALGSKSSKAPAATEEALTALSDWEDGQRNGSWNYISPRAKEDRAVTCPNAKKQGCMDMWAPDLYGEFAGVCSNCGHHFPMEYKWFLWNVFDPNSVVEFNQEIEAGNPLEFENFDQRLIQAKEKTGLKSGCMTVDAAIQGTKLVAAILIADFRGGSVGVAEGEKFLLAVERAQKKRQPFLAYVHGTAGIRIQEGTNGVIQMPRCTMAVRRYLDAGGLYLVVYDTNSYAGPVASFLGCSPYQFAIRSSNVGFAGPGVIKETTGIDVPPNYQGAFKALSRGHIQGVWDRRELRENLNQALMTMGGRNLYYR